MEDATGERKGGGMRWYPKRKPSDKKKLREKVGAVLLQVLKLERNNNGTCEICGRHTNQLGKFHILSVGAHPKLEFVKENILLTDWMPCHYTHHHAGADDPRALKIIERIKELRGSDYRQRLIGMKQNVSTMSEVYLMCKLEEFKQELTVLKGGV